MAKHGGRDWKPGQSGNPKGRPPMDPQAKTLQHLTKTKFREIATKYMYSSIDELDAVLENPDTIMLERIVVNILRIADASGDVKRLEFFLERLLGKVPDKIIDETEKRDININIKKWNQEK